MKYSKAEVTERLQLLRSQIEASSLKSGRPSDAVVLVAVSKKQSDERVRETHNAGQLDFGENYAQEMIAKQQCLADLESLSWHFIGHLQSNKAKDVVGRCKLIQSVDSDRIAGKIAGIAAELDIRQDILVEVNLGGELAKTGVEYKEALALCERINDLKTVRLIGLMGMAPASSRTSPSRARESFASLRVLFEKLPIENRAVLSMGMSGDFVEAIAEGSTMVRIGSAIFGERTLPF